MAKVAEVSVAVERCSYCGKVPSEEEVDRVVRRAQRHRECPMFRCLWCGETVRATEYRIVHDETDWHAVETAVEPHVGVTVEQPRKRDSSLRVSGIVHLRCVSKALPFLKGLDLEHLAC